MSLFKNIGNFISNFRDAAEAGADFNPLLKEVMDAIEEQHTAGKLDDVLYQAEQAYEKEHAAYDAKGSHTDAKDNENDHTELEHFLTALAKDANMPDDLKEKVGRLVEMKEEMEKALGPLAKFI